MGEGNNDGGGGAGGTKVRVFLSKAGGPDHVSGIAPPPSSLQDTSSDRLKATFSGKGLIEPPYDPGFLQRLWENSSALAQNVQAYVTNIDGLGHRLVPRIDLKAEDVVEKVRDAMWVERMRDAEDRLADGEERLFDDDAAQLPPPMAVDDPALLMPTDEDVERRIDELKTLARLEHAKLTMFLESVSPVGSFEALRSSTRGHREITGSGYWEVLRDKRGRLARFVDVPPAYVRCTPHDEDPVLVEERVRIGFGWSTVRHYRFFRRYAQAVGDSVVWFKELGDPRVVSRKTGRVYATMDAFKKDKVDGDAPASEIIHFRTLETGEPYPLPRWIGNMLSVLGSRAADEVNWQYFDGKAIPPLALLVSGGGIDDDSVDKIETYFRDHIKGRENFHRVLVIQAESDSSDPFAPQELPVLKFEKLTDVQQGDALFQKYDERNIDKIGSSFRLPRLLRGDVRDFNRATADASMRFADEQIFEPQRREFDSWFNRVIIPMLGITMWTIRSLGPQTRDPEKVAEIIVNLAKIGTLDPNETRELANDIIGMDLESRSEAWAKLPIQLTLAGFQPPPQDDMSAEEKSAWRDVADRLRGLTEGLGDAARHNALEEAAGELAAAAVDSAAGDHLAGDSEIAAVSSERG